jgi:D-glycero-alpha-D-manno-heptose 1-phosphate guanylyltransferase
LAFWLDRLQIEGPREVVLCVGYLAEQVREQIGERWGDLRIRYSIESAPLGTAGALRHALSPELGPDLLVLNGDSFCGVDFSALWIAHGKSGAQASLTLVYAEDSGRYGKVDLDAQDRLVGFQEKAAAAGPGWINAGVYLLPRAWLDALPMGERLSLERDVLPARLTAGIHGFRANSPFIDIGTPESYQRAQLFFALASNEDSSISQTISL